jgi:hypothetical protein
LPKITADLPQVAAQFGYAVDVDGDVAIVGAPLEDDGGIADRGAAYVFRFTAAGAWVLEARLIAADGAAGDRFGVSVAIGGDDALIGAPFRDASGIADRGAAYVFRRTAPGTWEATAVLLAADGAVNDNFGSAVALGGDDALIGAPFRDAAGIADRGAAYVFRRTDPDTWEVTAVLLAADGAVGDNFGSAVALGGDDALIGAPFRDVSGIADRGAAYVFQRTAPGTWDAAATLLAADGAVDDRFGSAVALGGDAALIGAPLRDVSGIADGGAAYVFRRTAADIWEATATLLAADGATGDRFGHSVALGGDDALIGAPFDDRDGIADQGSAFHFRRTDPAVDSWEAAATLVAADGVAADRFGSAVALAGDRALAGAPFSDALNLADSGAVYPFVRP